MTTQIASNPAADVDEESVLRDVLVELDRERAKRAELEAQIRQLTDERDQLQQQSEQKEEDDAAHSRRAFLAMEAQVQGFQQLVHALTQGKPAIAAAAKSEAWAEKQAKFASVSTTASLNAPRKTLPLHVVRLLEVLPWDPRAQPAVSGHELVFEWQCFDIRERKWQHMLKYFPNLFKSLPVVQPQATMPSQEDVYSATSSSQAAKKPQDRPLLVFLAGGDKGPSPPTQHGVMTDAALTVLYNLEQGFPFPDDGGTWEWLGGWRILKKDSSNIDDSAAFPQQASIKRIHLPQDEQGWSYAKEAQHFLLHPHTVVSSQPGQAAGAKSGDAAANALPLLRIRRRTWIRRRVLLNFPLASERTQQYLKLLAEKAKWIETARKLSDQLIETKLALTTAEESLIQTRETLRFKSDALNEIVQQTGKAGLQLDSSSMHSETSTSQTSSKEKLSGKFDWKRLGRGALIESITQQQQSTTKDSNANNGSSGSVRLRAHSTGDSATVRTTASSFAVDQDGPSKN